MSEVKMLTGIEMTSGMAMDDPKNYHGFITVRATSEDGNALVGQMTPELARGLAMRWLEAAEAADQDSIVMTMLTRDVGLEPPVAANFISAMRNERDKEPEPEDTTYDFASPDNKIPGEWEQDVKDD